MRKILSILGFVLAISHNSALARPKLVELSWGDLSPLIVDHRITLPRITVLAIPVLTA